MKKDISHNIFKVFDNVGFILFRNLSWIENRYYYLFIIQNHISHAHYFIHLFIYFHIETHSMIDSNHSTFVQHLQSGQLLVICVVDVCMCVIYTQMCVIHTNWSYIMKLHF